jgi:murein DD-endopeptidase MepM/ murein hydrolase activator NlpD
VPRDQRFPTARPRHRARARLALIAVTGAAAVLLAAPAMGPRGSVLDLRSGGAAPVAVVATPLPSEGPVADAVPDVVSAAVLPRLDVDLDVPRSIARQVPLTAWPREVTSLTGYEWPLAHPRLTLPFGPSPWGSRLVDGEPFHDGVDLATFCGDRIHAAHAGTVIAAGRHYDAAMGWIGDLGPYLRRLERNHLWWELPIVVVIDDGNGYRSMYAHFGRIVVAKGDVVGVGDLLGYEGMTGRASGCHLHYGLFSPYETATFRIRPDVVKRMKLPREQIARVDPLLVLPPKPGINAPKRHKVSPPADTSP